MYEYGEVEAYDGHPWKYRRFHEHFSLKTYTIGAERQLLSAYDVFDRFDAASTAA